MLDGMLLAVAIIGNWLCRSWLLERGGTVCGRKRVERPGPHFWGLLAGLVGVSNYMELNHVCFENGAAEVLTAAVGICGTWLLDVSASVHAAIIFNASNMDVHQLGAFFIPAAWLLCVALPSAALRRVFPVKQGCTPLNAPATTQQRTSVQRLYSSLVYQLWALLVWVPLGWVAIPATHTIAEMVFCVEGSGVAKIFASTPLVVILNHFTGLAIVLRVDFVISLQVAGLLSKLLLKLPSMVDALGAVLAKYSLIAYQALATPLCAALGLCEVIAVIYHVGTTGALVCLHRYGYVYPLVAPYLAATWLVHCLGWCDAYIRWTFNLVDAPSRYVGVGPQFVLALPPLAHRIRSFVYEELALLPLWTCGLSVVLSLLLVCLSGEDKINLETVDMVLQLFRSDERREVPVRMASAGLLLRVMVLVAQLGVRRFSTAANKIYTFCRVDQLVGVCVVFMIDPPAPSAAGNLTSKMRDTAPQPKRGWLLRLTLWSLAMMGSMAYATIESMILLCCVGGMLVVYYHVARLAPWLLSVSRLWVVESEGVWMGLALLPCCWLAMTALACTAYVANVMRIGGVRACMCVAQLVRAGCVRCYRSCAARPTPRTTIEGDVQDTATDTAPRTTAIEAGMQDTQLALVGRHNTRSGGNTKVVTALLSGFELPKHDRPLLEHDFEHDEDTSLDRAQELAEGFRQPLPRPEQKRRRSTNRPNNDVSDGQLLIEGEGTEEGTGQDRAAEQRGNQDAKNKYKASQTDRDLRRAAARRAKAQLQVMPDGDDDTAVAGSGSGSGLRNLVSRVRGSGSGKARYPVWIDEAQDHPRTSPGIESYVNKMPASVNAFNQLGSLTLTKARDATLDDVVRTEGVEAVTSSDKAVCDVALSVGGGKVMDAPGQPLGQPNADTKEAAPETEVKSTANLKSAKKRKSGKKGKKGKKTQDAVDRRISTSQGAEGAAASLTDLTPVTGLAQDGDNEQRDARITALEEQVQGLTQVVLLLLKQQEEGVAARLAGLHAEQDMLKVVAGLVATLRV